MQILLDTHSFIWFINGSKLLPVKVKKAVIDSDNSCYLSIASIWEIAIKHSLGKLELKSGFQKISEFLSENDIELLPIMFEDIEQLLRLEYHHRDPFDRLLIAQSLHQKLTIATGDKDFGRYKGVSLLW